MEKLNCVAIDMGASNIRLMAGETGPRHLDFREVFRFPNKAVVKDGHERWDIRHILGEIVEGIRKAASDSEGPVGSIGVDAWGVDFALLDGKEELTELPVAYRDGRTEGMEEIWTGLMSREETFRRTGINFYLFNTLYQLLSMKGSGILEAADRFLFLPSYVLFHLCGRAMNELTISSTSQLLNAETGDWDPEILGRLGVPPAKLGEICMPGTILGRLSHPDLDLPHTDAVAVCSHDTASAVVSVPFENDSSVFISTGTWCIVGLESEVPVLSPAALKNGFTNERGYGGSYRFLKNIVGLWLVQGLMKSLPVVDDYATIESLAMDYRGPNPVIDPGDPLFYNPANMRIAFDEFFSKTGQELPDAPGGYFRCAYDSLIFSFRSHIEMIEQITGRKIGTIHLIGGGCNSDYLTRQTAAICRRKVISGPVEAAITGNILVQSIAKGVLPGLSEARDLVRRTMPVRSYEPPPPDAARLASYRKFLELSSGS